MWRGWGGGGMPVGVYVRSVKGFLWGFCVCFWELEQSLWVGGEVRVQDVGMLVRRNWKSRMHFLRRVKAVWIPKRYDVGGQSKSKSKSNSMSVWLKLFLLLPHTHSRFFFTFCSRHVDFQDWVHGGTHGKESEGDNRNHPSICISN